MNTQSKLWEKHTNFIHFIPFVNCPELLERAVKSTIDIAEKGLGIVIDNRTNLSLPDPQSIITACNAGDYYFVYSPDVPLTTAQTMNLMKRLAAQKRCDFFTWIHGDGEITAGSGLIFIDEVERRNAGKEKWGCIFTYYDVFCAFNVEACNETGDWDWLRFPYYFLDCDYYQRLKEAGYPCVVFSWQDKMTIVHHNGASNTIKNDPVRLKVNQYNFPICERLFKEKYPNGIN